MTNAPRPHPRLARILAALAIAAVVLGAAACGDDKKSDDAGTGGNATTGTEIAIKDFTFSPATLEAKAGATITVKNNDDTAHTVTADDDSFDTGDVAGGGSGEITLPDQAGKVGYHCNIHNSMKGTLEVTA